MPSLASSDDGTVRLLPSDADAPRAAPRDIPALPQDTSLVPSPVRAPLEAMREAVQTLLGHRGDPLDRAITLRVAQQKGVLDATGRFIGGGTAANEPDLTPPPDVTNLRAAAGFTQVIVEWDAATYTQGHGHQKTNLYAVRRDAADTAPAPTAGDAVRVAEATGALTILALPSEPGMRWYLWAKFETNEGVQSLAFAGGINGVQVTTAQDVGGLLKALSGSIGDSQLVASLRGRAVAGDRADMELADDAIAAAVATHRAGRAGAAQDAILRQDLQDMAGGAAAATALVRQDVAIVRQDMGVLAKNLGAQWMVRMVLASGGRTVVGGLGLLGTNDATLGPTIDFGVLANRFFIGAPDDGSDTPGAFPFVVQAKPTTLNGVPVRVGVYIDTAFIRDGAIGNVKIGNAAVDDAKIANLSAAKLTVGDGTVGGNLKSANYAGGSTGWIVRPDGYAEFGFSHIRGTLLAAQIGAGVITADKIAANAVTADKIIAGAITADKLAAGSVTADKLAAGSVTAGKLAAGAVTTDTLGARSITTDKLLVGSVSQVASSTYYVSTLYDGPAVTVATVVIEGNQVTTTGGNVLTFFSGAFSVTLSAPTDSTVLLQALLSIINVDTGQVAAGYAWDRREFAYAGHTQYAFGCCVTLMASLLPAGRYRARLSADVYGSTDYGSALVTKVGVIGGNGATFEMKV